MPPVTINSSLSPAGGGEPTASNWGVMIIQFPARRQVLFLFEICLNWVQTSKVGTECDKLQWLDPTRMIQLVWKTLLRFSDCLNLQQLVVGGWTFPSRKTKCSHCGRSLCARPAKTFLLCKSILLVKCLWISWWWNTGFGGFWTQNQEVTVISTEMQFWSGNNLLSDDYKTA